MPRLHGGYALVTAWNAPAEACDPITEVALELLFGRHGGRARSEHGAVPLLGRDELLNDLDLAVARLLAYLAQLEPAYEIRAYDPEPFGTEDLAGDPDSPVPVAAPAFNLSSPLREPQLIPWSVGAATARPAAPFAIAAK
jgi:hypothetical protein